MSTSGEWPQGYRINEMPRTVPDSVLRSFVDVPVAVAGDCMGRSLGAMGLKAYHNNLQQGLCGPALTVQVRPGDNLMIHKALMMAQPGDIIVIDGGGDLTQALIGGLMRTTAMTKKIGGFVIDGAIRDLVEWADGRVPVFAKGHTHRGPSKEGPGQINVPIACAGMVVGPGDLILGDADGVICIPADEVEALLPRVQAHLKKEQSIRLANEQGTSDPERFNAVLRAKGLPV
ncbi:methyltransferase [Pollutimonas subterranea]|uniref:Putative 4-hydroxy-4-methyl-2-oxoglutarate aldolase n=1 Tax=Pollutimonas subterranea TaxID=2045210 RepID=A0A2N4U496_9BURK|nr:RraA family protein [Pollutimonas subterranea]PLC49823.1 methyltransferase [Pollutimonas subterranea]